MKILKKYEPRYSELEGTDVEVDFEDLQDETVIALNQYVISSKKTTPTKQRGAVETKEVKRAREKRELQERLQVSVPLAVDTIVFIKCVNTPQCFCTASSLYVI